MIKKEPRNKQRQYRHSRVRRKVAGTSERPRLVVFRSAKHIYAQIVDDIRGATVISASSLDKEVRSEEGLGAKEKARKVGEVAAKRALESGIKVVVFDRAGYKYHGRIAELAAGAREAGLEF